VLGVRLREPSTAQPHSHTKPRLPHTGNSSAGSRGLNEHTQTNSRTATVSLDTHQYTRAYASQVELWLTRGCRSMTNNSELQQSPSNPPEALTGTPMHSEPTQLTARPSAEPIAYTQAAHTRLPPSEALPLHSGRIQQRATTSKSMLVAGFEAGTS
jgi:hypothetical protein